MTWADHLTRQAAIRAALGRGDTVAVKDLAAMLVQDKGRGGAERFAAALVKQIEKEVNQ
jgi:hypothetical protein